MVSAVLCYKEKMRRADRLLKVIQLLRRHRRPLTGARMAEELEISLRTLYRDIADLITDGVPIRGEAGVGYVLGEGYDLPPLMFNSDELDAVMLGLSWVARRGDQTLQRAAADTVAKIGTVLPEHLRAYFYDAPLITPPTFNQTQEKIDLAAIRKAIRTQTKITIEYEDESQKPTSRIIWPIAISYFDAQRLVVAWCELRQGFRHFRSDRVLDMRVMEEKYREPRLKLLAKWREERKRETTQL
jgi:predicted DNA-binding transcriptional regulator YafY